MSGRPDLPASFPIVIRLDDLEGPEIAAFLEEHLTDMHSAGPPGSKHFALDLSGLRKPEISFWSAWANGKLVGCCALKRLDSGHAEVKSMRVALTARGSGIGGLLVAHVITEARARGHSRLSLETGSVAFFDRAHRLYRRHGFDLCGPFGSYEADPNSVFMTLEL